MQRGSGKLGSVSHNIKMKRRRNGNYVRLLECSGSAGGWKFYGNSQLINNIDEKIVSREKQYGVLQKTLESKVDDLGIKIIYSFCSPPQSALLHIVLSKSNKLVC